jgi:hypothetical protein
VTACRLNRLKSAKPVDRDAVAEFHASMLNLIPLSKSRGASLAYRVARAGQANFGVPHFRK